MMTPSSNPADPSPPAMKILKIFGLVVAVHAIAFVVIFANPGCRSTNSTSAEPVAAVSPAPYSSGDDYVPVTPVNPDEPAAGPVVGYSAQTDGRFAPTRPGAAPAVDTSAETIPASTYTVQRGDSLWAIAHKNGLTTAELAAANSIPANSMLKIGQKLLVPSKGSSGSGEAGTSGSGSGSGYVVKAGDTLSSIASRHGTTIAAIRDANNLRSDLVRVGQELKIPDGASSGTSPSAKVSVATTAAPASSGTTIHVVKMGETLGAIARRYKVSVAAIAKANNITDPTRILIGQELAIPGAGAPATVAPPPPPPVTTTPVQTPPPSSGDLDAALPPDFIDAPVIEVEPSGAPKIE